MSYCSLSKRVRWITVAEAPHDASCSNLHDIKQDSTYNNIIEPPCTDHQCCLMTTKGCHTPVVPQIKADQALIDDNYNYKQNILIKSETGPTFQHYFPCFCSINYGSLFQVYLSIKFSNSHQCSGLWSHKLLDS